LSKNGKLSLPGVMATPVLAYSYMENGILPAVERALNDGSPEEVIGEITGSNAAVDPVGTGLRVAMVNSGYHMLKRFCKPITWMGFKVPF